MKNTIQQTTPTLESTLKTLQNNVLYSYNWHRIGMIESFNIENQTANIQLVDVKVIIEPNGSEKYLQYPLLQNIPVIINKNNKGGITTPIEKGDFCLLSFNDRDIDNWYKNGTVNQKPLTARTRNFSDAIATIGLHPSNNSIQNYNNLAVELNYLQSIISIQENLIKIQSGGKIKLANNTKNLLTILTTLINTIKTLQTSTGGFVNANTLDASITELNELLL